MSETAARAVTAPKPRRDLARAVVRFAGDSGDGMQLTGEQFTLESAVAGRALASVPDLPAEIRAPAGARCRVWRFPPPFCRRAGDTPGHAFGETAEIFSECYQLEPAEMAPGLYRAMTGNRALAWGLLAAAERSKVPIVYGAYPITPASGILEELAMHKRFRIRTIQAEDEIAAASAAIGASFGGAVGVTASSGPGIALKGEAIGLAVTAELPLVIFDIQRGGPSTGLPTKTEQADLMQALYGRNREALVVVLAPATPGDCFFIAYEAVRIATKYMVPVMVLSDGFLANGSEPWRIPDPSTLPPIEVHFRTDPAGFFPYLRDPATLGRPWVRPGTPGLEHRIGGIEKQDGTGDISYTINQRVEGH